MTETKEDTETFTVTLTSPEPAVTCTGKTPHYENGCALLKHYAAEDGTISLLELGTAIGDLKAGTITQAEFDFVTATWKAGGSINAKCSGCYTPPAAPAQGQLEELTYPASVEHGASLNIAFKVHNTGGQAGTFNAKLYQGSTKVGSDSRMIVQPGSTAGGAIANVTAPASGTSVTYTLKLFLET